MNGCYALPRVDTGMKSPSPSDLCWVIGFTAQGSWIAPVIRSAVRLEWDAAKQLAARYLGDETLALELMEAAIQQTAEHLEEMQPISVEETRIILARSFRNAVRRKQYANSRLYFVGTSSELEPYWPSPTFATDSADALLDLEALLRDTPADLRQAMLLRYGASDHWSEVGERLKKSKEAVRKSCERELRRIRKRLGL